MQANRSLFQPAVFLAAILMQSLATSQLKANVVGIDAQNFNAITSGLDFVTVHSSETLAPGVFNIGLFANYARNTLPLFTNNEANKLDRDHSDSVTGADINIGYGLMNNWDIGLSFPQIISQTVKSDTRHVEFGDKGSTEVRLNTKLRLWGERDYGVAIIGTASFNRIASNPYVGSGAGPTTAVEIAADTTISRIALGLNVGYRFRSPGEKLPDFPIEPFRDQYIYSAAASYHFPKIDTKVIAEIFASSPAKSVNAEFDRSQSSAEALLGLKYDATRNVALHLGAGTELGHGVASPDVRVYGGVNVTFGPWFGNESKLSKPRQTPRSPSLPKQETIIIQGVMFAFDSSKDVLPGAKAELRKLVEYLKKPPVYKNLVIEGHTDSFGSDEYNQDLSQRRADTIRRYLIEIHKLDPASIEAIGYGELQPIADNGNYQGRQLNRRVEFKIAR